jgi:antitoxin component YwqK of YwqJK toxin-antitoxin module
VRYVLGAARVVMAPLVIFMLAGFCVKFLPALPEHLAALSAGCPSGTKAVGGEPPEHLEQYCEITQNGTNKGGRNGPYRAWYPGGGKKAVGAYDDFAAQHGPWTEWYESGQVRSAGSYNSGRHGDWTDFYDNGQVKERSNWQNGKRWGITTRYDEKGTKLAEEEYHGELDGVSVVFHQNGAKHFEINMKNGYPLESWKEWGPGGEPIEPRGHLEALESLPPTLVTLQRSGEDWVRQARCGAERFRDVEEECGD